jgi:hypothetical protein
MIVTINHLEQSGATLDFMFQKPFHSMRKFIEAITEIRYSEAKQFKETNQQNIFNLVASGYSSCEYLPSFISLGLYFAKQHCGRNPVRLGRINTRFKLNLEEIKF